MKMKRIIFTTITMAMVVGMKAENDVLCIKHQNICDYVSMGEIDSLYFSNDGQTLYLQPKGEQMPLSFVCNEVSYMSCISSADAPAHLQVLYEDTSATVHNPYLLGGLTVMAEGAYVTVCNSNVSTEYTVELSGTTSNGSLVYQGEYKTTLVLNGVSITSQSGPAIDIQCGKRIALELKKGTENTLADSPSGSHKAALYCKGHLEVDKSGVLQVTGRTAHAIAAKEYIKLKKSDGIINILGAVKDGIHCKQYFMGNGLNVNIRNVGDDGIQTELDGESNDDGIADGSLIIKGGAYTIENTTDGYAEGSETYTAKGLSSEGDMLLAGGTIQISMTGSGGKGIRVEGTYTQGLEDGSGPQLTVCTSGAAFSTTTSSGGSMWGRPGGNRPGQSASGSDAKAIKVLGAAVIYGGQTWITTSCDGAEGLESKTGITISGGNHYYKCYDDCINSSGIIRFAGGNTVCYSFGNDAVDSNYGRSGAITISGGTVFAYTTAGSPEEGLDCDNNSYITITGGLAVSAGGSQGGGGGWGSNASSSQSVGSATQGYYLGSSPSSYGTSYYYTLCNTSGQPLCTFRFEGNVSNSLSLLTASDLGKGSVSVRYGTTAPTASAEVVCNVSGMEVFYVSPTVTTKGTTASVTSK